MAGVTKGYLSKVESGHSTPSVGVMVNLCDAYGIRVADILMPDDQRKPISIVRSDERTEITRSGTDVGYVYELAARAKMNARAHVFIVTVPKSGPDDAPHFKHTGEEIFYVLEGRIRFSYGGAEFILAAGDCLQFDASIEHRSTAEGGKPARLFVVTIPDRPEGRRG